MFDATCETLENMVFMEVVPLRERRNTPKFFARIEIKKPFAGTLTLITTEKLARNLAEAIQEPVEGSPTYEMMRDTLGEVLNTIAGGLMRRLTPENETFALGLPETFSEGECVLGEPLELARFQIEGQTLVLAATGPDLLRTREALGG